jgi:dTDP-4-amino-4,6-dideoxygalactose transaminase
MNPIPFVDLRLQHKELEEELRQAVARVLSNGDFILGASVERFEQAFAAFLGVKYSVGVGSGLDALRLAMMVLDIGPGAEVIVPANTYIATALAVTSVGARPVLVDCQEATGNLDVNRVSEALTPRTRAIIPVHLAGLSADMDDVKRVASAHHLHVVEDAAQAHGTRYKGMACGSLGILGCFSFYPSKNLGACGDGGLVATNESRLADRLRRLRNYGQRSKNDHVEAGLNSRLDTLQAEILDVKLRHLPRWNESRAALAGFYESRLRGLGDIVLPRKTDDSTHTYHLFVIRTRFRDALKKHLMESGIESGVHYPAPIHLQKAYEGLGHKAGDFPVSERLSAECLSLPMYPQLTEREIERVADCISGFFNKSGVRPAARS